MLEGNFGQFFSVFKWLIEIYLCAIAGGNNPALTGPLQDQTVIMPEAAKFVATITPGEPRAKVQWFKGPKELAPDSKKYSVAYEGDQAVLNILKTDLGDAAEYTVKASNKAGEVTSKAQLTVHGKCLNL